MNVRGHLRMQQEGIRTEATLLLCRANKQGTDCLILMGGGYFQWLILQHYV